MAKRFIGNDEGVIVEGADGSSAVPAGYVGEKLSAVDSTFLTLTAPASAGYTDVANVYLDIPAGVWLLTYSTSVQAALSGTGQAITKSRLYNQTDSVSLIETSGDLGTSTVGSWSHFSANTIISIDSTKRVVLQAGWQLNATPVSLTNLYVRGDRGETSLIAVRIA